MFFICNEALSLLENAAEFVPIPDKLKDTLLQLRNSESENDSDK
jgi:phage-related holin